MATDVGEGVAALMIESDSSGVLNELHATRLCTPRHDNLARSEVGRTGSSCYVREAKGGRFRLDYRSVKLKSSDG